MPFKRNDFRAANFVGGIFAFWRSRSCESIRAQRRIGWRWPADLRFVCFAVWRWRFWGLVSAYYFVWSWQSLFFTRRRPPRWRWRRMTSVMVMFVLVTLGVKILGRIRPTIICKNTMKRFFILTDISDKYCIIWGPLKSLILQICTSTTNLHQYDKFAPVRQICTTTNDLWYRL